MGWSGGVFTRAHDWTDDAGGAYPNIEAVRMDEEDDNLAAGINATLHKGGQNSPTADLPMAGYKHTAVGNATARDQYLAVAQFQDAATIYGGTSGGSANAQTLTPSPAITAYVTGQRFHFKAGYSNSGACTINVSGVGVKSIYFEGAALAGGEIVVNRVYMIIYDGTNFHLLGTSKINIAADLNMNSYKITSMGSGTSRTDGFNIGQFQDAAVIYGTTGGTADAQTLTLSPAVTAYAAGMRVFIKAGYTNTGACTININGVGASNIYYCGRSLVAGEITSGRIYELIYDGTQFQILNPTKVTIGCRATNSVSYQTIPTGTKTSLTWDTEVYDVGGFHSTVTNTDRITIPTGLAGKYMFKSWGTWDSDPNYPNAMLFLKNTGEDETVEVYTDGTSGKNLHMIAFATAVAGDYFRIQVWHANGGNNDFNKYYFMATYLGE